MQNGGSSEMYSIGDLATEFEISPRAIRFYEDQGLIAPQRIGNNRVYTHRDRARLKLILRGKRLGFALSDIKELLDLYDVDKTQETQLRATLEKGRERIAELERQLEEITVTLQELRVLEKVVVALLRDKKQGAAAAAAEAKQPERTSR
jgi:DNA-binding transcriptional MerR regulator